MRLRLRFGYLETALLSVAILTLAVRLAMIPAKARGLPVSIAVPSVGLCGDGDRLLFAFAQPDGLIKLNEERPLSNGQLEIKLKEIFNGRTERVIFAVGEPDATYGQMVALVENARRRVDQVALVTHAVMRTPGPCGVPTLPPPPAPRTPVPDLKDVPLWPW
jgi:biopolymer transport protein ExbD